MPHPRLTPAERLILLGIARMAVAAGLDGRSPGPLPPVPPRLRLPQAAFVTLRSGAALRGCIGTLAADRALAEAVAGCAVAAALEDPRFPPLRHGELAGIRFEISALGLLAPAPDPGAVVAGRHGVVISLGRRRGLLLPQVAAEEGWDRDTFLMHACRKAGLPDDAWQGAARIEVFEAEVFSEGDPA